MQQSKSCVQRFDGERLRNAAQYASGDGVLAVLSGLCGLILLSVAKSANIIAYP
jgi:hypothetical protein